MQNDWFIWNSSPPPFLKSVYLHLREICWNCIALCKWKLPDPTFSFPWPAIDLADFYVPPVPVFVLPGSVSDGVPPSDWCTKQWRSALTLQTTPGALLSLVCLCPPNPAVHTNMAFRDTGLAAHVSLTLSKMVLSAGLSSQSLFRSCYKTIFLEQSLSVRYRKLAWLKEVFTWQLPYLDSSSLILSYF